MNSFAGWAVAAPPCRVIASLGDISDLSNRLQNGRPTNYLEIASADEMAAHYWERAKRGAGARQVAPGVDMYRFTEGAGSAGLVFDAATRVHSIDTAREPGRFEFPLGPAETARLISAAYGENFARAFRDPANIPIGGDLKSALRPEYEAGPGNLEAHGFADTMIVREKATGTPLFAVSKVPGHEEVYQILVDMPHELPVLNARLGHDHTRGLVLTVTAPFEGHVRLREAKPLHDGAQAETIRLLAAEKKAWREAFAKGLGTPTENALTARRRDLERLEAQLAREKKNYPAHLERAQGDWRSGYLGYNTFRFGVGTLFAWAFGAPIVKTLGTNQSFWNQPMTGVDLLGAAAAGLTAAALTQGYHHFVRVPLTARAAHRAEMEATRLAVTQAREEVAALTEKREHEARREAVRARFGGTATPPAPRFSEYRPPEGPLRDYFRGKGDMTGAEYGKILSLFIRADRLLKLTSDEQSKMLDKLSAAGGDYGAAYASGDAHLTEIEIARGLRARYSSLAAIAAAPAASP